MYCIVIKYSIPFSSWVSVVIKKRGVSDYWRISVNPGCDCEFLSRCSKNMLS